MESVMKVYFNEKSRSFLLTLLFVCFSLILFFSCGGEKANVPDDESVIDNEIEDSNDVETEDEIVDEVEEEENDSYIDEVVYAELESLDDCLDSSCKNLCFLQWDEESGEEVKWYYIEYDEVYDNIIFFTLESTSDNRCYTNSKDPYMFAGVNWDRIEAYSLPIRNEQKSSNSYYFLLNTNEEWQGKKK